MKKQFLILSLLLTTTTFSSLSFGEWEQTGESLDGTRVFFDNERLRVRQGQIVYFYLMLDYLKPSKLGHMSAVSYIEGDCNRMSI